VLVLGACGCRPPTEVTVVITTNVACEKVTDTGIVVGTAADVEQKHAGTVTSTCTGGTVGSLVLVPSKARDAAFVVKVVTGVGVSTEDCLASPTRPTDVKGERGCIVARRELGFIPQTPLTLPIVMHQACIGVQCAPDQTCVEGGLCASDKVDPHLCAGPGGCEESALGSGLASSSSGGMGGMGGKGGGGPTGPSSSSGMGGMGGMMSSGGGNGGGGGTTSSSITGGAGGTGPTGPSSSSGTGGAGGTGSTSTTTMTGSGGGAWSGFGRSSRQSGARQARGLRGCGSQSSGDAAGV